MPPTSQQPALPVVRSDHTDDYHGNVIAEPYRWLEDAGSAETKTFVDAQNKLTRSVLKAVPERAGLIDRLTQLWNYFPNRLLR